MKLTSYKAGEPVLQTVEHCVKHQISLANAIRITDSLPPQHAHVMGATHLRSEISIANMLAVSLRQGSRVFLHPTKNPLEIFPIH